MAGCANCFTLSFWAAIGLKLRLITVEPIIFFYAFGSGICLVANQALIYRKVCVNLYNVSTCDNLTAYEDYLDEAQKETSKWNFYIAVSYTTPTMCVIALYGSWSDRISRKVPMLIVSAGTILTAIINVLNAVYITASPAYVLLANVVYGITGGSSVLSLATLSYLSEVTAAQSKTPRMAVVYACKTLSSFIASMVAGVAVQSMGFVFAYSLALGAFCISGLYTLIRIKDIKPKDRDVAEDKDEEGKEPLVAFKDLSLKHKISELFGLKYFVNGFLLTVKKRPDEIRKCLVLTTTILFAVLLTSGINVFYLFINHPPLSFSQSMYGYYVGFRSIVDFSSHVLVSSVFKKFPVLSDQMLLVVAITSEVLVRVWLGSCVRNWMVFIEPFFGYMCPNSGVFVRSILAAIVPADELAQIYAVIGFLDCVAEIFNSMLFNGLLYPATVEIYPGLVMFISAVLGIIPLSLAIWVYVIYRRHRGQGEKETEKEAEKEADKPASDDLSEHSDDEATAQDQSKNEHLDKPEVAM